MFCPKCGIENVDNAQFCENCGYKLNSTDTQVTPPSQQASYPDEKKQYSGMVIVGYITAILISLVGIIIGAYLYTRDNTEAKKNGRNIIIIGLIVMIIGIGVSGYLILGTDVYATDDISEEGATNIVNMYIDNVKKQFPNEANNFQVGKPQKVKVNGRDQWKVPVIYRGNNAKIIAVIPTQNGYIMVPVRGTRNADGTITISIRLPNGQTLEVITGRNGLGNIKFPGGILFGETDTSTTDTVNTDTDDTSTSESQSSDSAYCHICESYNCIHITRYGETADSLDDF